MDYDYSLAETRLFHSLGLGDLMQHIPAPPLYRIAVEQEFVKGSIGDNVKALRRAAKALLVDGRPSRMTKEFDKLVEFSNETENVHQV